MRLINVLLLELSRERRNKLFYKFSQNHEARRCTQSRDKIFVVESRILRPKYVFCVLVDTHLADAFHEDERPWNEFVFETRLFSIINKMRQASRELFFQTRQLLFRKLRAFCVCYVCIYMYMYARTCVRLWPRFEQTPRAIVEIESLLARNLQFRRLDRLVSAVRQLDRTRERSLNRRPPRSN